MFESIGYRLPTEPDDVRTADDLDAELAALVADPRARWAPGELDDMTAAATACPAIEVEELWSSELTTLQGQLNRVRCLLAAARADLDAATDQRDTVIRERDTARTERAESAAAITRARSQAQASRTALDDALVDLALARADATLPAAGDPSTLARRVHDAAPGPTLAAAIAAAVGDLADPASTPGVLDRLGENTLVEIGAACGRPTAWAMAGQMAAAAYADRIAATPLAGDDQGASVAVAEMALACGVSRYAMGQVLTTAQLLPHRFPRLYRLLVDGRLEWSKTRLVIDKTLCQSEDVLTAVQDGVAPVIAQATKPQLAALIDQLIAKADPTTHQEQAAQARQQRRVTFRAAGNGMGIMSLFAAADDVQALRAALNEHTFAARRAQPDLPASAHPSDPDRPWSGPLDPDGRHPAATRTDTLIDLILGAPGHPGHPGDVEPAATARTHARADVVILIPLSVLTGTSQTPCDLAGHGPVPAQPARELAATGTWRRAAVDDRPASPTHATILGLGRTTHTAGYVPGTATRRFVQLRDGRCRFPGCRQSAAHCDLDHRVPWGHDAGGGDTCDCNLQALCRHHHRLKTTGGYTNTPTPNGTRWTTPAGRTHHTHPEHLPG